MEDCDCCKQEGRDWKFLCGEDAKLKEVKLYGVKRAKGIIKVSLCRLCEIELFRIGEGRFLKKHGSFAVSIMPRARLMPKKEEES